MKPRPLVTEIFAILLLAPGGAACADVFELTDGGRLRGVLVERGAADEYVVRTDTGGLVTLTKRQVHKFTQIDDDLLEYRQRSRSMPDTVEAHRQLAQWCKEHQLSQYRKHHLQRILQLDPSDQETRKSLGYHQHQGEWLTRDQVMAERGLLPYKGDYLSVQNIALLEQQERRKEVETQWQKDISLWRRWLENRRVDEGLQNIRQIRDPLAAQALVILLAREKDPRVRDLYLSTLGELKHPITVQTLVRLALEEPSLEVRQRCLDDLLRVHQPVSITPFVKALNERKNTNNVIQNAAEALERLGNPAAISPLIDALVTTHRVAGPSAPPGEMNAAFDPSGGGGGLTMGGGKKTFKENFQNGSVRRALNELSGGQDFEYNELSWRHWFVNQQAREYVDARRDE